MARNYKVSEHTAKMIDSMRHLYNFYDEFYTLYEEENLYGPKLTQEFQDKWHALTDCVLLAISYRLEHALLEDPEGLTRPQVEF